MGRAEGGRPYVIADAGAWDARQVAVPYAKDDSRQRAPCDSNARPPDSKGGNRDLDLRGVVEPALGRALLLAAEAGQWALVSQLANELETRRVVRQGPSESRATVVPLGVPRKS
jgi:hypothetical protein